MLKKLFNRFNNSSTFMTWFSLGSRPIGFVILIPLILTKLTTEEIALWYLFGTFINLQVLADFGFYNTFVRLISFSLSGGCNSAEDLNRIESQKRDVKASPNIELVGQIIGTMKSIYRWLTLAVFIILVVCSPLLSKSIEVLETPFEGWLGWFIIIFGTSIKFSSRRFSNFLLGQNKVALVRRWEGFFSIFAVTSNFLVMFFSNSLFLLVISNQVWTIAGYFRNRYLAYNNDKLSYKLFEASKYDKKIFKITWPLAWKSGISSLTSQGTANASGILYAQFNEPALIGTYLFAIKIITVVRSFSQAPFYSKIPLLSLLRGKNDLYNWEKNAQKGMFIGSMVMVLGVIGFDLVRDYLLIFIDSNIQFPDPLLWLSLGLAYLLHRYGAMHTHLYTTINKVNSHISDTISSIIMIIFWIAFYNELSVMVFPIGMIVSYLGFYVWFAGYYSYKFISSNPLKFEIKANLIPFITILTYILIVLL